MGLFKNIFGGSDGSTGDKKVLPWTPLQRLDQLPDIEEKSKVRPQIIFKHSTTCGISRMVLNMFTDSYAIETGKIDLYFLDLQAHREVSNEVAIRFQVIHQSPQLLVIKNNSTVFHTSHGAISEVDLEKFL